MISNSPHVTAVYAAPLTSVWRSITQHTRPRLIWRRDKNGSPVEGRLTISAKSSWWTLCRSVPSPFAVVATKNKIFFKRYKKYFLKFAYFVPKNFAKHNILWLEKIIKIIAKNVKKSLTFCGLCCIVNGARVRNKGENCPKRASADCTICDEAGGCGFRSRFFRGVCPISNRAKEYCVQRVVVR